MYKIIEQQLDKKLIKLSLVLAIIYCLLFNIPVSIYKFNHYKATLFSAILELTKDFIYIYIFCFIMFLGFSINRVILIISTIFLFVTGSIASYYLYAFKIIPTKEIMGSVFSTDLNEIYEIASLKMIIWLVFCLFTCIYTLKHFAPATSKLFVTKLLSAICLFIAVNNLISPQFKVFKSYFPIQYLHNSYLHFTQNTNEKRQDISKNFSYIDNSDEEIIAVLVIGESARFDHFQINGYERETTPYLSSIANLYSFKAQSSSNLTYISVPSLLSRHSATNLEQSTKETSFLSILTKLGFDTTWIGTQSLMKNFSNSNLGTIYDDVKVAIIPGGSALFSMNSHDEKMLPYFKDFLNSEKTKQFFVLHTSGQHWNYSARYPKEFEFFKPVCTNLAKADPSTCDPINLVNSYDNSILYGDFFLHNVIKLLKDKNAFLIYVSDHGESLGEDGYHGHGSPIVLKEQMTIPFIVWVSDTFKSKHPELVNAINQNINNEISHDYVFHSMLDCLNIDSTIINKSLSLCKDQLNAQNLSYSR